MYIQSNTLTLVKINRVGMAINVDARYEIRDVIYGFVIIDEQEREIINSPEFQRLRRIRQLSLTEMVYPGANHTRFEHSLGVLQMATEMYDCLINNKSAEIIKGLDESGKKRWRKVIRLAALLHDIGHPPFSHSGEGLFQKKNEKARYDHEEYSIRIIKEKFRSLIEQHKINLNYGIKAEEVTALLGDKSDPTNSLTEFALLWKNLISGQVDADRADYLLRDSIHSGVNYGLYDKNRLIRCMTLAYTKTDSPTVAIEYGGWHTAESLVIARYQMFNQLYFHKVRRIYDFHITEATKEVLKKEGLQGGCYPTPDDLDAYLKFDDWTIWGELKCGNGGTHGSRILTRNHYKCVFETSMIPSEEEEEQLQKKKEEYEKSGCAVYVDEATTKWYKIDKDILICSDGISTTPLSELSSIINSLTAKPMIKRLYVEREHK